MKLYIKIENDVGDKHQVVVNCDKKIDGLTKAIKMLPKSFTRGKRLKPRIYVSEIGFDSENYEYVDIVKVMRKADFEFDE